MDKTKQNIFPAKDGIHSYHLRSHTIYQYYGQDFKNAYGPKKAFDIHDFNEIIHDILDNNKEVFRSEVFDKLIKNDYVYYHSESGLFTFWINHHEKYIKEYKTQKWFEMNPNILGPSEIYHIDNHDHLKTLKQRVSDSDWIALQKHIFDMI